MKKLFLSTLIIVSFFISCTNTSIEEVEIKEEISLKPADTITLKLPVNIRYDEYFEVYNYKGHECIGTDVFKKNRILIFNKKTGTIIEDIKIKKEGNNGVGTVQSVRYINNDSIFVIKSQSNQLFLINSKSEVLNSWKTSEARNISLDDNIHTASVSVPLIYSENKIYCCKSVGFPGKKSYVNDKHLFIYNLKDSILNNEIFTFPDIYKKEIRYNQSSYGYSYIVNNDKNIVVSYFLMPDIYLYSDSSLLESYNVESQYVDDPAPTSTLDFSKASWDENKMYEIEKGSYKWMKYDKKRDYIIRLVLHKSELYDEEGNLNKNFDKEFSLQIINNKFELIGEQKFPKNTFDVWNILPVEGGILISTNNNKNPSLEEDKVKFVLYKYSNE